MYANYYNRLFGKAWEMTKLPVGISGFGGMLFGILLIITALFVLASLGQIKIITDELYMFVATVIALVLLVPLLFIVNCFRAAVSLDLEWKALYGKAMLKLDNRAEWQSKLDQLWILRSEGITLRNKCEFKLLNDFQHWVDDIKDWRNRTEKVAGEADPNLENWIHHLDTTVTNPGITPQFIGEMNTSGENKTFTMEHDLQVRMASTVLDRLARFLLKEFETERRLDE